MLFLQRLKERPVDHIDLLTVLQLNCSPHMEFLFLKFRNLLYNFSLEDIVAQIDKCNLNLFVKVITITGLRDGSLQNQFLPGRFLWDISLKISNGTIRSKVVGRFAPKQITGRFTHFHNMHVYLLKIKFGDTVSFIEQ